MSKLARACGMLCANPDFCMWLDWNRSLPVGTTTPDDARLFFYDACRIDSRKCLDEQGQDWARKMFAKIRTRYLAELRDVKSGALQKKKRFVNQAYLDWVKTLPCVASNMPADDAHHLIGHGMGKMGSKASDLFTLPLTREQHTALHDDPQAWERRYGSQWAHIAKTLALAVEEGVLSVNG